ncbi:MAG: hypothetical protein ABW223_07990 [Rariglobus sp.]
MKPLTLLLAASLIANAAFVAAPLLSRRTETSPPTSSASSTRAGNAASKTNASQQRGAATTDVLEALRTDNVEALRDFLREAGMPDDTVRAVVTSAIWKRYSERMRALQPKADATKPWWKDNNDWYGNMTREQRTQLRTLQREGAEEAERVLGPDKANAGWGWQDTRFNFIAEEKRKDVQEVEQDYQDLIQEVQMDMNGFTLPSDAEKIRFLQEEKMRDLAAVLTPQELADYDLRMSKTAQQLRWKMTRFDASEEEYRKIFEIQKAFDATQQTDAWGNPINQSPDGWKKRQESEKLVAEQMKAALGAERYADYKRSQTHEYQQLQAATKRLSLPPETASQVYDLRNGVSVESQSIAANTNLGTEQKKQALAALAKKTREQVQTSLGAEAAEVYLRNSMHWLNGVEQGNVLTLSEDGSQTNTRPLPAEPKKPVAK